MEATYDSKVMYWPDAATGGSVANFDRHQVVFLDDIACDDSATFARAAGRAAPAPDAPTSRHFKCGQKCKKPASECVKELEKLISTSNAIVDDTETTHRLEVNGRGGGRSVLSPSVLFQGRQNCGGCSRSPAWDALESPSPWFAAGITRVQITNLSKLLSTPPTSGFTLIDTWEKKTVTRLAGTTSHAATAPAWSVTNVKVQCFDGEAWAEQSCHGDVGTFKYPVSVPLLGCAQDDLASKLFAIGSLRNGRVLSAVMCSVELYHIAAKLLEMRDATMSSGLDTTVGGLRTSSAHASFAKLQINGPLPPKLSGYATSPTPAYEKLCNREQVSGAMRNTSIFAMSLGYDRGVYGGSLAGIWALMDSAFMFDYSTGTSSLDLSMKISETFATVRGHDTGNIELNAHLLDIVTVIGCNFTAIKAKAELEDARHLQSKPCVAIWDDLGALARYRMADAAFAHVWYDCPGDESSLVMAGLGCAVHDLIDIGPDVACGEISNVIPSLTGGDLSLDALRSVYIGLIAAVEWYATNDPFNTAGLAIMITHWWQLGNLRHRPVALMSRIAPSPEYAVDPEKLKSPPSFKTITHENRLKYDAGQPVLDDQRAELDRIEALGFPDLQGLIKALVRPVLEFADGKVTHLPIETTYCTEVLESCISRRHSEKIKLLWRLMLVMWKCGAMWATVLASTQYAHQGFTNCDRGRDDFEESTWAQN